MLAGRVERNVHPVTGYELERIALSDFTGGRAVTSQGFTAEYSFLVVYGDGERARYRWDYWAYGNTTGPLAVLRGNRGGLGSPLRVE